MFRNRRRSRSKEKRELQECRRKKENEESRSRRIRGEAGKLSEGSNNVFRVKEGGEKDFGQVLVYNNVV